MAEITLAVAFVALLVLAWAAWRIATLERRLKDPVATVAPLLEEKHREMLTDLHLGLTQQGDRLGRNLADSSERLSAKIDQRLDQIAGKVDVRLDEGFKKTNETFVNVMQRLATIDEAQKKIETLTGSVVSLQELLGDKRSRGAFGEVQLEALVRNVLPPAAFELQYTLSNGMRVDCALRLPPPTALVTVDSKFPLENYHRMFDREADPAEAVFAEIHAYHPEVVEYAIGRRVWIVSPTTLMAVLNTARAVLKDVETRRHIHIIKEELGKLGIDFQRFDERMKKLADHIRQAHQDAEDVQVSSRKISQRFQQIEAAEIEEKPPANVVRLEPDRK